MSLLLAEIDAGSEHAGPVVVPMPLRLVVRRTT
jgi:hypothetical protein